MVATLASWPLPVKVGARINAIVSVEQVVKGQFSRLFISKDWNLFKRMAEFYFQRAVFLRTPDVDIAPDLKLLARNCQKRLFIGIGIELLLKAIYLKYGFPINKVDRNQPNAPVFPFTFSQAKRVRLLVDNTYMLNDLISKLPRVPPLRGLTGVSKGLKIAKVFRNKEGHVVLPRHKFDPSNYRDIEASLITLYARAFDEKLQVRFSVAHGERGTWKITRSDRRMQRTRGLQASRR